MIAVFGSLNVDYIFQVSQLPAPGETVLGTSELGTSELGAEEAGADRDGASWGLKLSDSC